MIKRFVYIYIVLFSLLSRAQIKDSLPNFDDDDSINILLDEVSLLPKHKFSSKDDVRYYLWLCAKVFKAYPYAKLATQRIDTLKVRLSKIKSKSAQRTYTKRVQDYLEGEFTDQLKKMTRTEGRILIKLIHRQTGKTTFDNIKELRSGWNAFWYNTTANLFKLSLKTEYNPAAVNEDYLIEDILQRAFREGKLQEQTTALPINFTEIVSTKSGMVDVEEYKIMFEKMRKKGKIRTQSAK